MDTMNTELPELLHVELEECDGIRRHKFESLIAHLERHLDPSIRENILFFFLSGSRLYGTATEESDWDYVCVTKRQTKEARKSSSCLKGGDESIAAAKPFMIVESNVYDMDATLELYGLPKTNVPEGLRFDVSVHTLSSWSFLAYEQSVVPLEAQYLPPAFVLYKDPQFPTYFIDPPVLKTTASLTAGLKFANARPRLAEGNAIKAKKLGILGIRYLQFGIQLLETYHTTGEPRITDWHSIKPVWEGLFLQHNPVDYTQFELEFRPTFKSYDTKLRQIMLYPTLYTARERFAWTWQSHRKTLQTVTNIPLRTETLPDTLMKSISPEAYQVLMSIANHGGAIQQAAEKFHLLPSVSKCGRLLSLSLSCHAPIDTIPHLAELHGMILEIPNWVPITKGPHFHLARDLITLRPLLNNSSSLTPHQQQMVNLLNSTPFEVMELYDGIRVVLFNYISQWRVAKIGGSVDGSESIATRTTEGRGPPKTSIEKQFISMLTAACPNASQSTALDMLSTGCLYVFDMLSNCSRAVTANNPERLVFQFALPFVNDAVPTDFSLWNIATPKHFKTLTRTLSSIDRWESKFEMLMQEVERMNPFEQAGFELRFENGQSLQLAARSYWSVKASLGHQNRVLAFNVAADHFESETLLDVCIFGFQQEFACAFPHWQDGVQQAQMLVDSMVSWLDLKKLKYLGNTTDRKAFAASIQDVPPPLKSILFEWANFPYIDARDILSSLELATLRSLRETMCL